jgi:VanZ family protein
MRFLGLALGWGWVAAIAWLSLTSSPPKVDVQYSDKLGHFAAYGLLMFWFTRLYLRAPVRAAYAAGFTVMGIGLEFLQGYLGYRTYEVFDMFANTTGVLLGWGAALILKKPVFR